MARTESGTGAVPPVRSACAVTTESRHLRASGAGFVRWRRWSSRSGPRVSAGLSSPDERGARQGLAERDTHTDRRVPRKRLHEAGVPADAALPSPRVEVPGRTEQVPKSVANHQRARCDEELSLGAHTNSLRMETPSFKEGHGWVVAWFEDPARQFLSRRTRLFALTARRVTSRLRSHRQTTTSIKTPTGRDRAGVTHQGKTRACHRPIGRQTVWSMSSNSHSIPRARTLMAMNKAHCFIPLGLLSIGPTCRTSMRQRKPTPRPAARPPRRMCGRAHVRVAGDRVLRDAGAGRRAVAAACGLVSCGRSAVGRDVGEELPVYRLIGSGARPVWHGRGGRASSCRCSPGTRHGGFRTRRRR